jgi:hypothetical protein
VLLCCCPAGYLPSFWIKLRNLNIAGPQLQLPGLSSEVCSELWNQLGTQLLAFMELFVAWSAIQDAVACR